MGSFKVVFTGFAGLVAIVVSVVGLNAAGQNKTETRGVNAKSQTNSGLVRLSAAAKPAPEAVSASSSLRTFENAAVKNTQLSGGLGWAFGGKRQLGWHLYAPLIGNLIDSDSEAAEPAFAMRLSLWQRDKHLEPTGVLDHSTWSRMVAEFQTRRRYERTHPLAIQLVTIPVSDCYDPARAEELRKAEAKTFLAYKRMVAAAAADKSAELRVTREGQLAPEERFLRIVSAYRSQEYQNHLRKQSPNSGRAGLAVNSPHSTGRALDLYVGGEPVSTKDANRAIQTQTAAYRWLVKNAARFGFQPYFYEPWHWEYVGAQ